MFEPIEHRSQRSRLDLGQLTKALQSAAALAKADSVRSTGWRIDLHQAWLCGLRPGDHR